MVARFRPQDLGGVFENRQGVPGHGGQGPDAVVAAHDSAGLAAPAGPDGGPVQDDHVAHSQLHQGAGRAQPGDAGADDDDSRLTRERLTRVAAGQPGIQSVPARGTLAMAAASTVRAARSSGSRWWTSDLPQARASAVTSIVVARRKLATDSAADSELQPRLERRILGGDADRAATGVAVGAMSR